MVHQGRAANSQLRGSYIPRSGHPPPFQHQSIKQPATTLRVLVELPGTAAAGDEDLVDKKPDDVPEEEKQKPN